MIINGTENLTKNLKCDDIYSLLIDEIKSLIATASLPRLEPQILNSVQKNPFVEQTDSEDSIETFISISSLKQHIKETAESSFSDMTVLELTRFLSMILQIKGGAHGKIVKFGAKTSEFFTFLKTFFQNIKQANSPMENFIQLLEIEKNREIVKPFAIKYFKVVFYFQKPTKPSFYEVSIMNNMSKVSFINDPYFQSVINFILKDYTLYISRKYSCNTKIEMNFSQCVKFCNIIESTINGFNGSIIELETEACEISKVIYTMLVFFLNKKKSEFQESYGVKELFYCALRSVYQGRLFAKRLECMISSKLRWRFSMESEEYTIDKVYQTLFKHEYLSFIGKVRCGMGDIYSHSLRAHEHSESKDSSDENRRVMVTKIIQTTPKANKGESTFAFSPLSRKIGERVQRSESLNSKRKLRFDQ